MLNNPEFRRTYNKDAVVEDELIFTSYNGCIQFYSKFVVKDCVCQGTKANLVSRSKV